MSTIKHLAIYSTFHLYDLKTLHTPTNSLAGIKFFLNCSPPPTCILVFFNTIHVTLLWHYSKNQFFSFYKKICPHVLSHTGHNESFFLPLSKTEILLEDAEIFNTWVLFSHLWRQIEMRGFFCLYDVKGTWSTDFVYWSFSK